MKKLILLLICLFHFHSLLAKETLLPFGMESTTHLETFLHTDGTLNIYPGFTGSLDLSGYQVYLDDCNGIVATPLKETAIVTSSWSALGAGLNNACYALAIDNSGNIYAGGAFTTAGGNAANRIAKWDGSSWSALGSGLDANCSHLAIDNSGNVYAGGDFTTAGGNAANRIAKWNGSNWSALGSGLNNTCSEIAIDNTGNVYAVGGFTTAGGNAANRIAMWNGSSWSALGSGLNNWCSSVTVDNSGNVYAGGVFTTAGGNVAHRIAKWNGSTWSALGLGLNGNCSVITLDNSGNVYAGGDFTIAGGNAANRIAKWNGSSWSALGSGLNSVCWAIFLDINGDLCVGGGFTTAGGNLVNRIAKWDGSTWSSFGLGFNQECRAIAVDNSGNVFAGGSFTTAGGTTANRIALWEDAGPLPVDLLYFKGAYAPDGVQLTWATESEFNNKGYQVEHSLSADEWQAIDFIEGKGNSLETNFYNYFHQNPKPGHNYYRLKQLEYDGAFEYSNVINVSVDKKDKIKVYPNPTNGKIEISGVEIDHATLRIIDNTGTLVRNQMLSRQDLDLSDLPEGLYFLTINNGHQSFEGKIIKQ